MKKCICVTSSVIGMLKNNKTAPGTGEIIGDPDERELAKIHFCEARSARTAGL